MFIVRESFLPLRGSVSFRVSKLADHFIDLQRVFLVPRSQKEELLKERYHECYVYKTITDIPRFYSMYKPLSILSFGMEITSRVRKILQKHKIKIIYGFGAIIPVSSKLGQWSTPLVLDIFETDLPSLRWSYQNSLLHYLGSLVERTVLSCLTSECHEVIVLTDAMKKYLEQKEIDSKRIHVVYDGTDPKMFKIRPVDAKRGNPSVVFIGDIDWRDGVDDLVISFADVVKELPEVRLYIIGDGPLRSHLTKLVYKIGLDKHVLFTGWIPFSKLVQWLPNFMVGVVPSKNCLLNNIVIPRKTFELMAAGVPVVASNLEAIKEIIEDGVSGVLFEAGNLNELKESILKLLTDEVLYNKIQQNGRAIAEKYSTDSEIAKINTLLRKYL
jgi:glycosyltransferase involved in cell wall biosynthesis